MRQVIVLFAFWICAVFSVRTRPPMVSFELNGEPYYIYVEKDRAHKLMVMPETKDCDRTIIFHDFLGNKTIYKDVTAETCFVSPLYRDVVDKVAVIFKAVTPQYAVENTPAIILLRERRMDANEITSLGRMAFLCRNYATFWVRRNTPKEGIRFSEKGIDTDSGIVIGRVFAETANVPLRFASSWTS
ncbi:integral membrane protein 2B [Lingula anatina]|uniref:Integral membrane protein 2B n=1 Tax=Lingula anatina TaxID=7574 RepID=A0A1S3JDD4_LINAN|nr:integral membrane protein 2B [Lingula anatina]|eukprot:XP_013408181.1 integral membrane protein 2B [Lingula anatina]